MTKNRLEAFSDGVIAIIITIMVLELKVPHGAALADLRPLIPVFLSYVLSFIFVGIYWNNHHHMLHAIRSVSGGILWANMHLLFWLSLVPFVTGWMGENHFAAVPVAAYGVVLLGSALAYTILTVVLIRHHGRESDIALAIGDDTLKLPGITFAQGATASSDDRSSHVAELHLATMTIGGAQGDAAPRTWQRVDTKRASYAVWTAFLVNRVKPDDRTLPTDFSPGSRQLALVKLIERVKPRKIDAAAMAERVSGVRPEAPFDASVDKIARRKGGYEVTFTPTALPNKTPVVTLIKLPRSVPLPLKKGEVVTVEMGIEGGGPNARGTLVVTDAAHALVLAIGQGGTRIPGITLGQGAEAKATEGNGRTVHTYPVILKGAFGEVPLPAIDGGITWTVNGHRYAAWGSAASVDYPPGAPRLPDSVGGWLDVAIVRVAK